MPSLLLVSVVPLFGAFLLGALDGVYFHLRRDRLFAFPASRREHMLHSGPRLPRASAARAALPRRRRWPLPLVGRGRHRH